VNRQYIWSKPISYHDRQ